MRRLQLTERSLQVVADFSKDAPPLWRQLLAELLRCFLDGTWEQRFHPPTQLASSPDTFQLDPDTHLHVFYMEFLDEADGLMYADIYTIEESGASGEFEPN